MILAIYIIMALFTFGYTLAKDSNNNQIVFCFFVAIFWPITLPIIIGIMFSNMID